MWPSSHLLRHLPPSTSSSRNLLCLCKKPQIHPLSPILQRSRHIAVGPVAVVSLLLSSMVLKLIDPASDPIGYSKLVLTTTLFTGLFQTAFGLFRLGFLVDFLSHAVIVGFMAGATIVIWSSTVEGTVWISSNTVESSSFLPGILIPDLHSNKKICGDRSNRLSFLSFGTDRPWNRCCLASPIGQRLLRFDALCTEFSFGQRSRLSIDGGNLKPKREQKPSSSVDSAEKKRGTPDTSKVAPSSVQSDETKQQRWRLSP